MLNTLFLLNFENCMLIAILDNGTSIILLNNHKECSLLWSTWLYQKNDVHSFQYSLERMSYISLLKILYNNALLKCNTFREMWIAHKLNSVLPNSGCHRYACWMYTRIHFFFIDNLGSLLGFHKPVVLMHFCFQCLFKSFFII